MKINIIEEEEEEELYFEIMSHSPFHQFCEFEGKKEDKKKRKVSKWLLGCFSRFLRTEKKMKREEIE